jgi:hypothetical protein
MRRQWFVQIWSGLWIWGPSSTRWVGCAVGKMFLGEEGGKLFVQFGPWSTRWNECSWIARGGRVKSDLSPVWFERLFETLLLAQALVIESLPPRACHKIVIIRYVSYGHLGRSIRWNTRLKRNTRIIRSYILAISGVPIFDPKWTWFARNLPKTFPIFFQHIISH